MGKIICDVCGTSYSEATAQCPICGSVHPADNQYISAAADYAPEHPQYQYVKGGRFSKANVKKRNKNSTKVEKAIPNKQENAKQEQSNKGLVITVLVLLLAIIAVIAYIAFTIIIPIMFPSEEDSQLNTDLLYSPAVSATESQDTSCVELLLEHEEISLRVGDTIQLNVEVIPSNTTDTISFSAVDEALVSVDSTGMITALSAGETMVTVSCGTINTHCFLSIEPVELTFDQTEVSIDQVGAEVCIYSGNLPVSDVLWYSDDDSIATITDGVITAVGNGITTVYGEYADQVASCVVWCTSNEGENETSADDSAIADNGPYRLDNPYGVSDTDASIRIGSSFTLYLVDKDENRVSGVTWSVEKGYSCTVDDGLITGVAAGQSSVVATYGGESYTCIVRVS